MIKNSNRLLRALCCLLMGVLLSAQAAFATQPCVKPGMSAARAVISQTDDDCHKFAVSDAGLCVVKCTDSDKLSAHTPLVVPLAPTTAILLPLPSPDSTLAMVAMRSLVDPVRDPPKTIRFCSFLI